MLGGYAFKAVSRAHITSNTFPENSTTNPAELTRDHGFASSPSLSLLIILTVI